MMLACNRPGQVSLTALCASKNSWSRPGFTRKRTALKAVTVFSHGSEASAKSNRVVARLRAGALTARFVTITDQPDFLLSLDHLCQLVAQFRTILMAMDRDGVLDRRFQKLLLGIGGNRDRAVHLARVIPAIHKHS